MVILQVVKAVTPPKPEAKAVTVPQAPHFQVEERLEHYSKEVEPARRARMTLAERNKMVSCHKLIA